MLKKISTNRKKLLITAGIACLAGVVLSFLLMTFAATVQETDFNNDGKVDFVDLSTLLTNYGKSGLAGDVNKDSVVDIFDLSATLSNYGKNVGTISCSSATMHTPGGPDGGVGCWPGPANTGVPQGTNLSNYSDSCTITTASTIIDRKNINCNLDIRALNVKITNSKITGAVIVDSSRCSTASYEISDSTIFTPDINLRGLMSCNYKATRVDVSGGQSMAWCDTCTIQDSFLHNPLEDPAGAAANHAAHNSTVRVSKFATLKHNTLWCDVKEYPQPDGNDTSGCSANQTAYSHDGSPPYNSRIENNLYMPTSGGYCAYGGSTSGALSSVHDIVFINNVFKRGTKPSEKGTYVCGYYGAVTSFDPSRPGNQWTNNRWDDGTILPSSTKYG